METVAIVGVGLIGGSFALALQNAGFRGRILGVSSPKSIAAAKERGAIHEGVSLTEAAERADLIYLSQPINGILNTLEVLSKTVKSDTLVTDAGSTKTQIVRKADASFSLGNFLGGHPMAGKEARGVEAADPNLFRDRPYVLTPRTGVSLKGGTRGEFVTWLERVGAIKILLTPEEHDRIVAFTSHLPQLASTAIAATLAGHLTDNPQLLSVAGPGLSDTTRLVLSSFEVWHDILVTNAADIDQALELYIDKLSKFRQNLTNLQLREEFTAASAVAQRVRR